MAGIGVRVGVGVAAGVGWDVPSPPQPAPSSVAAKATTSKPRNKYLMATSFAYLLPSSSSKYQHRYHSSRHGHCSLGPPSRQARRENSLLGSDPPGQASPVQTLREAVGAVLSPDGNLSPSGSQSKPRKSPLLQSGKMCPIFAGVEQSRTKTDRL